MDEQKNSALAERDMIQEALEGFDTYIVTEEQDAQHVIEINTDADPELDPNSPEFNPKKYRAYLDQLQFPDIMEKTKKALAMVKSAAAIGKRELVQTGFLHDIFPRIVTGNLELLLETKNWAQQINDPIMQQNLLNLLAAEPSDDILTSFIASLKAAGKAHTDTIEPYLEKEIPALRTQPGLEDITLDRLKQFLQPDGETIIEEIAGIPTPAPIIAALKRARTSARRAATAKRRKAAEAQNFITPTGNLTFYSSEALQNALNSKSIYRLPGDPKDFSFDKKGKLNKLSLAGKLENLTEYHVAAFGSILTRALNTYENDWQPELDSIDIYLPEFFLMHGIDPRPTSTKRTEEKRSLSALRRDAFINLISPFDNLVGTPDGGKSFYRLMAFTGYDEETETARIATPYFFRLAELKDNKLNRLLHPDVITEQNTAAVELASVILTGVLRRGRTRPDSQTYRTPTNKRLKKEIITTTNPDGSKTKTEKTYTQAIEQEALEQPRKPTEKKFTYDPQYRYLIENCPQLSHKLKTIEQSNKEHKAQLYNNVLQKTFTSAYRIILDKSDVHKFFEDFQIADVTTDKNGVRKYRTPTKSILKNRLVITHKGKPSGKTE